MSLKVIGPVPGGLPYPNLLNVSWSIVLEEIPAAIIIAVIGFIETIAVAKKFAGVLALYKTDTYPPHGVPNVSFAVKKLYTVDVTQELYALGLANAIGSFFGSCKYSWPSERRSIYSHNHIHMHRPCSWESISNSPHLSEWLQNADDILLHCAIDWRHAVGYDIAVLLHTQLRSGCHRDISCLGPDRCAGAALPLAHWRAH